MTKTLSVGEAAYIAGFVDGEATISIWREYRPANRSGFRYKAAVHLFNTDRPVLEWIRERVGAGWVVLKQAPKPGHKPGYVLIFSAGTVKELLPQILPYLRIKQAQARIVLEFVSQVRPGARQATDRLEPLYQLAHALNRRGTSILP